MHITIADIASVIIIAMSLASVYFAALVVRVLMGGAL